MIHIASRKRSASTGIVYNGFISISTLHLPQRSSRTVLSFICEGQTFANYYDSADFSSLPFALNDETSFGHFILCSKHSSELFCAYFPITHLLGRTRSCCITAGRLLFATKALRQTSRDI